MTSIAPEGTPAEDAAAQSGIAQIVRDRFEAIRQGEVGSLPVVLGIAAIVIVFAAQNSNFLRPENFNNLIVQMAGTTALAFGVVFVLLLGEIDLSISYVSGVAGVVVAELTLPGSGHQIAGILAIVLAVITGAVIGFGQGSFVAFIGVPSFVVTLAGYLIWQGVILISLGTQGVITIQDNTVNNTASYFFSHTGGWIIAAIVAVGYAVATLAGVVQRRRHSIMTDNLGLVGVKVVGIAVISFLVALYSNSDSNRGLPLAGLIILVLLAIWTYVAKRTTFGRHVYAVGGNAEAARRAGINVRRIRVLVFMIASGMAAFGGVILAARLRSVDLNAGGGTLLLDAIAAAVIGGTSLFGGRGQVKSALLGAIVIAGIENGSDTVGYSSGVKYVITGAILLAAVTIDTITRRRLAASGR